MVVEKPKLITRDAEQLKEWLDSLPEEDQRPFSQVMAHRAAMRVLPYSSWVFASKQADADAYSDLILAVFRASIVSRVGFKCQNVEISIAADEATTSVAAFARVYGGVIIPLVATAAQAANSSFTSNFTHATALAVDASCIAVYRAYTDTDADAAAVDIWGAIGDDIKALSQGGLEALIDAPLWLDREPKWWSEEWSKLWPHLHNLDAQQQRETGDVTWQIWIDWYTARSKGETPWGLPDTSAQEIELRIALADGRSGFWDRRPEEVHVEISNWINAAWAAIRLSSFQIESPGNQWRESGNFLEIGNEVTSDDLEVARNPVTQRAHQSLLRKALKFGDAARGFDELYGWTGFGDDYNRLTTALECEGDRLAEHIWDIYDATLTVASYLQQDNDIRGSSPAFSNAALSAAHRREFIDLVRSLAPWVRRFPTAQQEDENAANFLQCVSEQLTSSLLESAHQQGVITDKDRELIKALLAAMERNGLPAEKAGIRAHFSVRNLTFAGAMFLAGSVASGTLEKSELHGKITDWMAERVDEITEIVADAPDDIQVIIKGVLADIANREQGGDDGRDVPILPDGGSSRRRRRS